MPNGVQFALETTLVFLAFMFATFAQAAPSQLVTLGDGLVAIGAPAVGDAPLPGGWVSVLADCLEEGAPAQWAVVDHGSPGQTAKLALDKVDEVAEIAPRLVVVAVGAQELANPNAEVSIFEAEVSALLLAIQGDAKVGPDVLLVGIVPPTLPVGQDTAQAAVEGRTEQWNLALKSIADQFPTVRHVDIYKDWPTGKSDRSKLMLDGFKLSHQGHARVAAAVCDMVLNWTGSHK